MSPNKINRGKMKKLNEREEQFLSNFFDPDYNGDVVKAYIDAGYDDGPSAKSNSRKKLRDLTEHITLRAFDRIGTHVPWALNELVNLIKKTKNDNVKLRAIQDILDRSGLNRPTVIQHEDKSDPKAMTSQEVAHEIASLLNKANRAPELKVVGGNDVKDN